MLSGSSVEKASPTEVTRNAIAELSKSKSITREQERIADASLADSSFALLANRSLNQGADPAWLSMVVPDAVNTVASHLGLTPEQADAAIKLAHSAGPGAFKQDSPEEFLWLVLAKHSIDEANKSAEPAKVLAASARKMVQLEQYVASNPSFETDARAFRQQIIEEVKQEGSAALGTDIPLYANDLGFYVAYRTGHHAAAVRSKDGLFFYGTDGSLTLEQSGIKVDKQLSPTFGIVFPQK